MNITKINEKIKNIGFENLLPKEKDYKAKDIWKKRQKNNKWGGLFKEQENFVKWYLNEPRVCKCCGVEEEKVRKFFYEEHENMTRGGKRGRMLELDKIDNFLSDEPYDENNCGLLCYVCNNAKSNFINKYESFEPIAKGISEFWKKNNYKS